MRIDRYIGVEFESNGRGPKFDCWGLCIHVLKEEFGYDLPDFSGDYLDSSDSINIPDLVLNEKPFWSKMKTPNPGNVILFNIAGNPLHVGVVIGGERMLHIAKGINACVERYTSKKWRSRIEGFYAYTQH